MFWITNFTTPLPSFENGRHKHKLVKVERFAMEIAAQYINVHDLAQVLKILQ